MVSYTLDDFLKHSSELATISPAAVELINKINLPNIRRDEIANLVSKDEVLYANIFKCTNSAAYALRRRPKTVSEAIDILGINETRNIVFMVAAKKVFVDLELWRKSVFTAIAAQKISQKTDLEQNRISNIYIAGLMQSMGTLVFKMFYKKEYSEIETITNHRERAIKEEDTFGLNSQSLTYEIVKDFGLPESIVDIIKTQAYDSQSSQFKTENAIIDLSLSLAEIDEENFEDQEAIDELIDAEMINKFELSEIKLDADLLRELNEATDNFMIA